MEIISLKLNFGVRVSLIVFVSLERVVDIFLREHEVIDLDT